jgi:hypothetical protein
MVCEFSFHTQTKNGRSERLWCELDHDTLNMCPKPGVEVGSLFLVWGGGEGGGVGAGDIGGGGGRG